MAIVSSCYKDFSTSVFATLDEKVANDRVNHRRRMHFEKEYRTCVHEQFSKFKEKKWATSAEKGGKKLDELIPNWLGDIKEKSAEYEDIAKLIDNRRISSLVDANTQYSIAIHFRMMAETDDFAREQVQVIDNYIFGIGESYISPSGEPIFKEVPDHFLNFSYPKIVDLGANYQRERDEFQETKDLLLEENANSITLTTAVYGAGGYGKSSLAHELCYDKRIREKFLGGIYWLPFGLKESDAEKEKVQHRSLAEAIEIMLGEQFEPENRPKVLLENRNRDIQALFRALPSDLPILLVADDIWTLPQSSWFSLLPKNVRLLVTTRVQSIADQTSKEIQIKRLTDGASFELLTHGMQNLTPEQEQKLRTIAKKFKGWPLVLNLANGVFKPRKGNTSAAIDHAILRYESFLDNDDVLGWDTPEPGTDFDQKRQKFVGYCIRVGLDALGEESRPDLLLDLGVFPDDTNIPVSVIIDYWCHSAKPLVSPEKARGLLDLFEDYSFLSSIEDDTDSIRLHDEILAYFRQSHGAGIKRKHAKLLSSIKTHCAADWETLPQDHEYGWAHLFYHLEASGQIEDANEIRTDFGWITNKLSFSNAFELQRSYASNYIDAEAKLVGRALKISAPILFRCQTALAHQLYGRLGHSSQGRIANLISQSCRSRHFWPVPNAPHLNPIGNEILRIDVGSDVHSVLFSMDGTRILTVSRDRTARLWDAESGAPVGQPMQHDGEVNSALFSPDGTRVLTVSGDSKALLWDAESGAPVGQPMQHGGEVNSALFSKDETRILTASRDETARLWDAESGAPVGQPMQHDDLINSALFSKDGTRILTASWDATARLWDAESGAPVGQPMQHDSVVISALCSPDGTRVLTATSDETALLWDAESGAPVGQPMQHDRYVNSALFSPDGTRVLTASDDRTARLWDAESGAPVGQPMQHDRSVDSALFSKDGKHIYTISAGKVISVWHTTSYQRLSTIHSDSYITHMALSHDGHKLLLALQSGNFFTLDLKSSA